MKELTSQQDMWSNQELENLLLKCISGELYCVRSVVADNAFSSLHFTIFHRLQLSQNLYFISYNLEIVFTV